MIMLFTDLFKSHQDMCHVCGQTPCNCTSISESENPKDVVAMDVPFLIRALEYAREDAKGDLDLHNAVERMLAAVKGGEPLDMDDYNQVFGAAKEINEGASLDGILARYPEEVENFKQGGDLDYDLESALWDYYFNRGDIRNYNADAGEWIAQQLASELGLNEESALDRVRDKLSSQGYALTQQDRLRDRERHQEKLDAMHQYFLNLYQNSSQADDARAQFDRDLKAWQLQQMQRNADDNERTMDMFRDRLNRYQSSTQRDVDPEQLAAISNIQYQPRRKKSDFVPKNEGAELDKLKATLDKFKTKSGKFPEPREPRFKGDHGSKSETLGRDGKIYHWQDPRAKQGVAEGDISQLEKDIAAAPVEPIANMEADEKIAGRYDADEFDSMVNRLKKLAGAGPLKTVYDPQTRRYKNVPTAVQPKK